MENWKKEVKRLNVLREKLGITFYKLEQLSGKDRGRIGGMFKMVNEPGLGFYLLIKDILEKEIEVDVNKKKDVVVVVAVDKKLSDKIIKNQKKAIPEYKENYQFQNDCDCRMDGTLFIRGKSGCKKTKDEHKF